MYSGCEERGLKQKLLVNEKEFISCSVEFGLMKPLATAGEMIPLWVLSEGKTQISVTVGTNHRK